MTDRYVLFGNPVMHSKSPLIHGRFAEDLDEDMSYGLVEPPVDGFGPALQDFFAGGGKGCNVTAPFKLEAFAASAFRTEAAELAGSANTLRLGPRGIEGHNTDGEGLLRDIELNLGHPLTGKRVLLLGAGGAARGVALPFLKAGPETFVIANRTAARAEAIREMMAPHGEIGVAGDAPLGGFDVVVNATSAALTGGCPDIPEGVFEGCALAYDMTYGKGLTPFLAAARAAGVGQLADGVGMLVEQAAAAFCWWRGKMPETGALIRDLAVPLA